MSVTQAFNTTSSMGRLTLNVLLSFAQLEREVTGERILDKIAASKKKGVWMGGGTPRGYGVVERKLLVQEVRSGDGALLLPRTIRLFPVPLQYSPIPYPLTACRIGPEGVAPCRGKARVLRQMRANKSTITGNGLRLIGLVNASTSQTGFLPQRMPRHERRLNRPRLVSRTHASDMVVHIGNAGILPVISVGSQRQVYLANVNGAWGSHARVSLASLT